MHNFQRRQSCKCSDNCACIYPSTLKKLPQEPNEIPEDETTNKKGCSISVRYIQCFLLFLGISIAYSLRVNLSVAIVAMTDQKRENPNFKVYEWDPTVKSLLLSSFYWGYVLNQVPGGYLSQRYGSKMLLLFSVLFASILTIITPICTDFGGWPAVLALRVIEGFFQGVLFPSTHTFLAHWAPVSERGRLGVICYSGMPLGTALMFATSGVIASSPFLGWPGIFYVSGSIGCVWSLIWFIFGYSSPTEHKSISNRELKYIESSLGNTNKNKEKVFIPTPWKQLFTSTAFMSCLISQCSQGWGFLTLLTQIPTYMGSVLKMNIKNNAILSSLPYFAYFILGFIFVLIRDKIDEKNLMSKNKSRKTFNTIGHCIPAIALAALGFITQEHAIYAVVILVITCGMNSAINLGAALNHIDLAPNHAGILMGLGNAACALINILAPLSVGIIVTEETNQNQWRIVFFITSAVYFIGNLIFVIFGTTHTQSWNDLTRNRSPSMMERKLSIFIEAAASQKP